MSFLDGEVQTIRLSAGTRQFESLRRSYGCNREGHRYLEACYPRSREKATDTVYCGYARLVDLAYLAARLVDEAEHIAACTLFLKELLDFLDIFGCFCTPSHRYVVDENEWTLPEGDE